MVIVMKKQIIFLIFILISSGVGNLYSTATIYVGNLNLQPAWNLAPYELSVSSNSQLFSKQQSFPRQGMGDYTVPFRTFNADLGINYGLARNWEIGLNPRFYQKFNQHGGGINAIQDIQLSVKYSPTISFNRFFHYGFALTGRFPWAKERNLALEHYISGRGAIRLAGMLSFTKDMVEPDKALNFHINVAYQHHLDVGQTITNSLNQGSEAFNPTQELLLGAMLSIPVNPLRINLALHGNAFIQKPPATAYYRDHSLFFSPVIQIPILPELHLNIGSELRLSKTNKTFFYTDQGQGLPYSKIEIDRTPAWRFKIGVDFTFRVRKKRLPHREVSTVSPVIADSSNEDIYKYPELEEYDMKELDYETYKQEIKKDISKENIEKLKKERIMRDRMLENLRREIERRSGKVDTKPDQESSSSDKESTKKEGSKKEEPKKEN